MTDFKVKVENAWGDVKHFGDSVSAYIVMHPKTGALIGVAAGWLLGVFVHP